MKIMKKSATIALTTVLAMTLLAACQENHAGTTPTVDLASPAASEASGSNSEVIKEGTIKKEGNVVLKELSFVYNDVTIALSDIVDDAKLEGMLGKATAIKSHTYAADDGTNMDNLIGFTEKQYTYPGVVIKTIDSGEGKQFKIFNIKITDSKYTTVRNIKVGDSIEKLQEAYPEGNLIGGEVSNEEDDYRYSPVNYVDVMNFHIIDKKVESIQIFTLLD
ncbi:hypothetical protein BBD42_17640 [Paenibacillus sp. BIHB 4019]|uniref:Lipoprotein n=1 Tax=Paenibacillus sp. BIHB 4019 TaxID=1870819 RepID=A0A1B2DSY1_9BACL|nr:hypothetical protein BBD42_17640 [Paenibacillus sp. BIHB 4019]